MWESRCAAGGYGSGIPNDVIVSELGRGVRGVVDDGCDSFVTTDGGYEIMDLESKWSDDISMSAIVVRRDDNGGVQKGVCVCE